MDMENFIPEGYACAYAASTDCDPEAWLKEVCVFSNTSGGVLFFGVDANWNVIGLEEEDEQADFISDLIFERIHPRPVFLINQEYEKGKAFLVVQVFPGSFPPYILRNPQRNKAAAFNRGAKAFGIVSGKELLKQIQISPDAGETEFNFSEYRFCQLQKCCRSFTGRDWSDEQYDSFGLRNSQGKLTLAGALLADESPINHSRLICTYWDRLNKNGGEIYKKEIHTYSGSLFLQLEEGMRFLKSMTRKAWRKTATGRMEFPEYCESSCQEALINALIHRNYTRTDSEVHIDIFDDRITITSPGGMADGIEIQRQKNLDEVESVCRNPVLARLFQQFCLARLNGSGLQHIVDAYHSAYYFQPEYEPEFYSNREAFGVTLYNLNYNFDLENGLYV